MSKLRPLNVESVEAIRATDTTETITDSATASPAAQAVTLASPIAEAQIAALKTAMARRAIVRPDTITEATTARSVLDTEAPITTTHAVHDLTSLQIYSIQNTAKAGLHSAEPASKQPQAWRRSACKTTRPQSKLRPDFKACNQQVQNDVEIKPTVLVCESKIEIMCLRLCFPDSSPCHSGLDPDLKEGS